MSSPNLARATSAPERPASEQCMTSRAVSANNSLGEESTDPNLPPSRPLSTSPSKRAYTTEVVKALFGGGPVGDVIQDFSCSFQRQAGRLYVSTDGLFFYSNLFGFEKKIRIDYGQALQIISVRTTSLSVNTVQGEEYVFRSFENREYVLDIILSYHTSRGPKPIRDISSLNTPVSEELNSTSPRGKLLETTEKSGSEERDSSPVPDVCNNERQSVGSQNIEQAEKLDKERDAIVPKSIEDRTDADNDAMQWEKIKQQTKGWESALVNLELSCKSAKHFFDLFLSNDAINSLKVFQGNCIGDKNITVEVWKSDIEHEDATNTETSISRLVQFEHKSGVSMAKVTRQQTYQYYGDHACLKNVTKIKGKGVPDAFFVEDMWFIELTGDDGIAISVSFRLNFTKSTMLKSIIESRTTAETKQWYQKYSSFVRQKMHQNVPIEEEISPPPDATARMNVDWFALVLDWFRSLASSCQQIVPPTLGQKLQQQTLTPRVLLSSIHHYVSDLKEMFRNAPISLLFLIFALFVYRLKTRVTALETLVEDLEQRLIELEKLGFDVHPPTTELTS